MMLMSRRHFASCCSITLHIVSLLNGTVVAWQGQGDNSLRRQTDCHISRQLCGLRLSFLHDI